MFDVLISVGSVDGVLTSAAAVRMFNTEAEVIFTQAFQVNTLKPAEWGEAKKVLFVDLAVNNQNPQMTADFVNAVLAAGHKIVGICDEHDADAWAAIVAEVGMDYEGLKIQPVSQAKGDIKSSGALLLAHLGEMADEHTRALCGDADAGDRMDFSGPFASVANKAVKSAIADNSRRVHIVHHFATGATQPDATIEGWMAEYDEILANHAEILANKVEIAQGVVQVDAKGKKIDPTTLLFSLYREYKVVELIGPAFNPATKQVEVVHAFATGDKGLDVLAIVKAVGVNAGGFASKANVSPAEAEAAREAICAQL